jgi:mono/diheme cytochrome c family protein
LVGATHALAGEAGQWSSGQEVYTKVCAYCHETGVGPDIHRRGAPPEYARVVRNGRGAMPAFRRTEIDDESLAKLMTFIR